MPRGLSKNRLPNRMRFECQKVKRRHKWQQKKATIRDGTSYIIKQCQRCGLEKHEQYRQKYRWKTYYLHGVFIGNSEKIKHIPSCN